MGLTECLILQICKTQSPKFKLYSFAPLTDTAPPTAAGTASTPSLKVAPVPKSGFTVVEVDTFKEVSRCWGSGGGGSAA